MRLTHACALVVLAGLQSTQLAERERAALDALDALGHAAAKRL